MVPTILLNILKENLFNVSKISSKILGMTRSSLQLAPKLFFKLQILPFPCIAWLSGYKKCIADLPTTGWLFSPPCLFEGCSFCTDYPPPFPFPRYMVCSFFLTGLVFFIPMICSLGPSHFSSGWLQLPPNVSYLPPDLSPSHSHYDQYERYWQMCSCPFPI